MSNIDIINEMLNRGESVYIKDDWFDAAIRIDAYFGNVCFLKYRGGAEGEVEHSNDKFCQIELGGEFITKEEYDRF